MSKVAVLGAGSWGTALALLAAEKSEHVSLWARDPQLVEELNSRHLNERYLPGVAISPKVQATADLETAVAQAKAVLVVVPSSAMAAIAQRLAQCQKLAPGTPIVSCSKGIERETGRRMTEVLSHFLPHHPVCVLSGPNHSEEIARGLPAAAVLGAPSPSVGVLLQELITTKAYRVYTSEDICGIEWGGAVKNIFAIASGLAEGLGLGDNAKAALLTRGLAEMIRIGVVMGGQPETFQGLSGVGDLIATAFSQHSRNNRVGQALGRGLSLAEATQGSMVAEGVPNSANIYHVARKMNVRTPIIDAIYAILHQGVAPVEGLRTLLNRELRPEVG